MDVLQSTIYKEVHSFVFSLLLPAACFHLLLYLGSELGLTIHLILHSDGTLLLSSLFFSSPLGIALLAGLEYLALMLKMLLVLSTWDLSNLVTQWVGRDPVSQATRNLRALRNRAGMPMAKT